MAALHFLWSFQSYKVECVFLASEACWCLCCVLEPGSVVSVTMMAIALLQANELTGKKTNIEKRHFVLCFPQTESLIPT